MSQVIDQRVVEMRFDNKQFESAIADTQKTVKNFNSNLNREFGDSNKELDRLGDTADAVRVKFGLWDTIKFTALQKVISDLITDTERIVKNLSVDQVISGWQKYADKTQAVQTIMAGLDTENEKVQNGIQRIKEERFDEYFESIKNEVKEGTTEYEKLREAFIKNIDVSGIDYVEEQLEKLNWFADETSYSFIDMTDNVGKFIAAGVDLEDAVTAMQGVATWAAQSGANAAQASRVMYNLSQALGTGSVRVQDWMSVENANMATKEFKEMAIEAAKLKKTLYVDNDRIVYAPNTSKGVDVDYKNFRSTLSEGWFTSEVLTEVLNMYGKAADVIKEAQDLSKADTTSEMLKVVDAYKAASTEIAKDDIFNKFITKQGLEEDAYAIRELRKQFDLLSSSEYDLALRAFEAAQQAISFQQALDATKDAVSTKWMNIFQNIFGNYEQARQLWTDVSELLWDIFAGPLDELNEAMKIFAKNGGIDNVHTIITGALEILVSLKEAVTDVINLITYGTTDSEEIAEKRAEQFLNITEKVANGITKFKEFVQGEGFQAALLAVGQTLQAVGNVFKSVWNVVKSVFGAIVDAVKSFFAALKFNKKDDGLSEEADSLSETADKIKKSGFVKALEWLTGKINDFADWLRSSDVLSFITDKVGRFVNFLLSIPGYINKGFKALTGKTIGEAFQALWSKIKQAFQWIVDNKVLQRIWDGIKSFFKMIGDGIKKIAGVETYGELFAKIRDKIVKIFGYLKEFFQAVGGKIKELAKVDTYKELFIKIKDKIVSFFNVIRSLFSKGKKTDGEESITDAVSETAGDIRKGGGSVPAGTRLMSTSITNVTKGVGKVVEKVKPLEKVSEGVEKTIPVLESIGTAVVKFLQGFSKILSGKKIVAESEQVEESAKKGLVPFVQNLIAVIKSIDWKAILAGVVAFKTVTTEIKKIIAHITALNVAMAIKYFTDTLDTFADSFRQLGKAEKWRAIGNTFKRIALLLAVIVAAVYIFGKMDKTQLDQGLRTVVTILVIVTGLIIALMVVLKNMNNNASPTNLKEYITTTNNSLTALAKLMKAMAIAIILIAKAIQILAKIEDPNKLRDATIAVTILMGILVLFCYAILKMVRDDKSGLLKSGGTSSILNKNSAKSIKALAGVLIAISIATILLVAAVAIIAKTIEKSKDPNTFVTALLSVVLILAMVTFFVVSVLAMLSNDKVSKNDRTTMTKKLLAVSLIIIAMAVLVGAIAKSLLVLSTAVSNPLKLLAAAGAITIVIIAILVAIAVLLKTMRKTSSAKNATKVTTQLLTLSVVFIAMSAMISSIAAALAIISALDTVKMAFAALALVGLLAAITAAVILMLNLTKTTSASKILSIGAMFLMVAASIAIISVALVVLMPLMKMLSTMDFGQLLLIAGGIFAILAAFGLGGVILKAGWPGLVALAALLVALGIAFALIAVSAGAMGKGLISLAGGLVVFCTAVVAAKSIIIEAAKALAEALLEGLRAFIFGFIDLLIDAMAKIGELIIAFLKMIQDVIPAVLETVYVIVTSVLGFLTELIPTIVDFLVDLIVAILKVLAEHAYEIGTYLMVLLTGLIQAIADNIGPLVSSIVSLIANLIDALIPEMPTLFGKIADLIFTVVQSTFGAVLNGLFGSFGEALATFAESAQPFWDAVKSVDPAAIDAISSLGLMMIALTASSVLEAVQKILSFGLADSPLVAFGKQLSEFAPYLVKFANATSGIDSNAVEGVANASKAMSELYKSLPKEDGWVQKIFGKSMSLETFGKQLEEFGKGFVNFYKSIEPILPIDQEAVQSVTNAGATIAGLYNKLPKQDGWVQKIFGKSMSLKEFGNQLKDFGYGFALFYSIIKSSMPIDSEVVASVTNAGMALAGLYKYLPKEDGWVQKIFGKSMSLKEFGEDLVEFAKGFNSFYDTLNKGIEYNIVTSATNAAQSLAGLYNNLPKKNGVFQAIFGGDMNLKDFGTDLYDFAVGFNKFYAEISKNTVEVGIVETVKNAAKMMKELYDNMPKKDGFIQNIFGGTTSLKDFGTELSYFGSGFKSFYNEIKDLTVEEQKIKDVKNAGLIMTEMYNTLEGEKGGILGAMAAAWGGNEFDNKKKAVNHAIEIMGILADGVNKYQSQYSEVDKTAMNDFTRMISWLLEEVGVLAANKDTIASMSTASKSFKDFCSNMSSAIMSATGTNFYGVGGAIATKILDGFANKLKPENLAHDKQNTDRLDQAAKNFCDYFAMAIEAAMPESLKNIGNYIVQGLVYGVAKGQGATQVAAQNLANTVVNTVKNELRVKSPSRVMMEIGQYVDEGLVNGIRNYSYRVNEAASELGFDTVDTINQAIQTTGDYLGNATDSSMVLTPVLDLSQIQNGAAAINSMMASASGYELGGTFDYANRTESSRRFYDPASESMISFDRLTGAIEDLIKNPQGTINNTFTINSDADPREIAEEVSRILQTQVERRQAVWGQ